MGGESKGSRDFWAKFREGKACRFLVKADSSYPGEEINAPVLPTALHPKLYTTPIGL